MRQIDLNIQGSRVSVGPGDPCVVGEGNSTCLALHFGPDWQGLTKTAQFWDAHGQNPVTCLLGESTGEQEEGGTVYRLPIPPEPLAQAGTCTLVLEGAGEAVRIRTLPVELEVLDAPWAAQAQPPTDPTPTLAQQLQSQIDALSTQSSDQYANALTGTAQGTQLLRLEDVSPLAGQLDINVSGVDDPTAVKVTVCGSNLCDEAFVYGIIAGEDHPTYRRWVFDLPAGTYTYCFAQEVYMQRATVDTQIMIKTCATFTTPGGEQWLQFRMSVNGTSWDESNHLMVVPGIYTQDTMPAYEPYTGTSVTPQQDGSCRAAASGTALTVLADTPGAVITCTYPRDTNKAYDQLVQAIISMGGNV